MLAFKVAGVYTIHGRGIVLDPELPVACRKEIKPGDTIRLVFPEGKNVEVTVNGVEYGPSIGRMQHEAGVLIDDQFSAEDIPIGTEVHCD